MQDMPIVIATVGGEGARLYPLTLKHPKPLVSMCGRAILARCFETLARQGCRDFILAGKGLENTLYIKEYFKEGKGFSGRLKLRPEAVFKYQPNYQDRGSGDSVRYCMEYFDIKEDVLVISGDNVIDITLEDIIEFHKRKGSLLTVGLTELGEGEDTSQYGVAELAEDGRINRFVEKPPSGQEPSRLINTSLYIFSPRIREVFKEMGDGVKDMGRDVIPYLIERGYPVYGYPCEGYWADVGTPESLLRTTQDMLRGKLGRIKFGEKQTTLLESTRPKTEKRWIHPATLAKLEEMDDFHIGDYVRIGANCTIGKGTAIESSCIGDNCIIGEGSVITGSVVMDFVNIGKNVRLNKCIVGRYSTLQDDSVVDADLVVEVEGGSPDITPVIGEGVTIMRGSVIGPKKRVALIYESHRILRTGRFLELGYDQVNVYFIEK
jgi:NDP-sugar pyrophosphorylase family protein